MSSKLTANSVVFLILSVFAVIVAIMFRHPLLIYTAVFLITTNVVLFLWSQQSVRNLEVERALPRLAVSGYVTEIVLRLKNNSNVPRFGMLGYDLHNQLTPNREYSPVAFLTAQPGELVESSYLVTPQRSGVYSVGPLYLYGGDPFGFYKNWRKVTEPAELIVIPNPVSFRMPRQHSASMLAMDEMETVPRSGESTEFWGVHEWRSGEPVKRVHWPTTARLGRLISRQYEMNVSAALSALLIFDPSMQRGGYADNPQEYSLRMIAGLARGTIQESYHLSYLSVAGKETTAMKGSGYNFYQQLAVRMAHLRGPDVPDWNAANRYILHYLPQRSHLIVFIGDLNTEARLQLRQLAVHFAGLSVVTFRKQSFDRARRTDPPGPRMSLGEGYLVHQVGYRDDLSIALGQLLARTKLAGAAT